ncbi:MAG: YceI family protein [Bacteroidales bacterium]|nr:YceI family protein [Bacteroidales bacterium]
MKQISEDNKRKSWHIITLVFGAILLLSGSFPADKNPEAGKGQEQVFVIDETQSRIFWRVDAHNGIIPLCEGELVMQGNALIDAQFRVCMDSLRNLDIDYHLMKSVFENTIKSKEIFHTERFPYAYFKLCCSEKSGNDSLLLAGDLVIKDIENCIRFNTFFQQTGDSIQANTDTINIDRTNWGIFAMTKKYRTSESSYLVSDTIQFQIKLSGKLKDL